MPGDVDELVQGHMRARIGAVEAVQLGLQGGCHWPECGRDRRDGGVVEERQEGNVGDRRVGRYGMRACTRGHRDRSLDSALIRRSAIA
jgi:hypothetical protein